MNEQKQADLEAINRSFERGISSEDKQIVYVSIGNFIVVVGPDVSGASSHRRYNLVERD